MNGWLLQNEATVRLAAFFGIFAAMALWEILAARRPLRVSKGRRWLANLGLVVLNTLVLRLLFPTAAMGMAVLGSSRGWGLLNALDLPGPIAILIAMIALDLAIYLQHVLFHAVPVLWRLHQVHHADLDFDLTTGARFHPIEIVLSMGIKLGVIAALGPPAVAVLLFEVLLNTTAMFNHGNVSLPPALDRLLRLVLVTPDMHRVHHSTRRRECNSNFGFGLPFWDRLLGTYCAQPEEGHDAMQIGVIQIQTDQPQGLLCLLKMPFTERPGDTPLNHQEKTS